MDDVNTLEITEEKLIDAIKQQFGNNKDFSVTDNGDGSFLVSMNDTQRMYYIDETGKIIDKILKISTADELKSFRDDVNSGNTYEGWYVYLANDITLDINEEWKPIGYYSQKNASPTNENNKPFSGIFDGKRHEVNGIYINTTDGVQGLFGIVNSGTIKNIGVSENCNITTGWGSSAVVAYLYNNSYAYNCYNKSNLMVSNSFSGGVFGQIELNSKVQNCYNFGNISTTDSKTAIGGVSGTLGDSSQMYNCYNEGNINISNAMADKIGGVLGQIGSDCLLDNCFNNGQVNGNIWIGGIVGYSDPRVKNIQNCYNTGSVTGKNSIGGIVGYNEGKISNCYNIGNISGDTRVGGVAGLNNSYNNPSQNLSVRGTIRNAYSLDSACKDLCGENNSSGDGAILENSSLKTETEMKLLAPTLGSAFKEDTEGINNGYPILQWQ